MTPTGMTSSRSLTALAAVLIVALGGLLVAEANGLLDPPRTPESAALLPEPVDTTPEAIAAAPAEASREIIDRPLFFASRRPLPPEPPPAVEARAEPEPPLTFALVGTILTSISQTALVKPEKLPPLELSAGQSLDGWTVSSIDVDRIIVRHGATEQLLGLRDFGAAKALPAAARAPAAGAQNSPGQTGAPAGPNGTMRPQRGRR